MKKYSLKKLGMVSLLTGTLAFSSACSNEATTLPLQTSHSMKEVEGENEDFVYDSNAPIALPIETVEMENGELGYKIPRFYNPYLVDEEKTLPGMVPVLEVTKEYSIEGGCYVTDEEENTSYCGFEGAVAVYYPYYRCLNLKDENAEVFEELLQEVKATAGENSVQYQILLQVASGQAQEIIEQVYYDNMKSKSK